MRGMLLALLLLAGPAAAHGDAAWIQQMGIDCCSTTDCQRAPDGAWVRIGSGFYNAERNEWVPEAETRGSVDESFWECRHGQNLNVPTGGGKCLFVPAIGF